MYQPNFSDKRVQERIRKALSFARGVFSDSKPREWSSRHLDKYLGRSNDPLGQYVRQHIVTCTDDRYLFGTSERGICKKYILNSNGYQWLRDQIQCTEQQVIATMDHVVHQEHGVELRTGNFAYKEASMRLWHPLQRYRRQHKQRILSTHGYEHQYDINCCAPTLLLQQSQMMPYVTDSKGKYVSGPCDEYLAAVNAYVSNPNVYRQTVSEQLQIPIDDAKVILTALFSGAVVSANNQTEIYQLLDGDIARITWLKQDPFVCELRSDIKIMWSYLRPLVPLVTKKQANGKHRKLPMSNKHKWLLYFQLERRVLDAVVSYLMANNIKYFLEHDGWSTNQKIHEHELLTYVKKYTGFDLQLKYQHIEPKSTLTTPYSLQPHK